MRRNIILVVMLLTALMLASCTSEKSELQQATGASRKQTKHIEHRLAALDITYTAVSVSSNPIIDGMDLNWHAFDLIAEDDITHVLILKKTNNAFTAVLDSEGRVIEGLIDNGITPALFE